MILFWPLCYISLLEFQFLNGAASISGVIWLWHGHSSSLQYWKNNIFLVQLINFLTIFNGHDVITLLWNQSKSFYLTEARRYFQHIFRYTLIMGAPKPLPVSPSSIFVHISLLISVYILAIHTQISNIYLSVASLICLSIIVEYHFCIGSTHKPVITWYLWVPPVHKWKNNFSYIDAHCKTLVRKPWYFSETLQNFWSFCSVKMSEITNSSTIIRKLWCLGCRDNVT